MQCDWSRMSDENIFCREKSRNESYEPRDNFSWNIKTNENAHAQQDVSSEFADHFA